MHSSTGPAVAGLDPPESFVGEFVEGGYGHRKMLFFRVLDFIVGDAVEGLNEHHDGRDAGAGDGGGVVEGAGREAMRSRACVGDGSVAEGDEVIVEEDRLDLPEALPGNGDVAFGGEAFAGFPRVSQHTGEGRGVEVALVQG